MKYSSKKASHEMKHIQAPQVGGITTIFLRRGKSESLKRFHPWVVFRSNRWSKWRIE